jgi:tRNA threonylcarbamoyladenosine biosynthesis protein TsaE
MDFTSHSTQETKELAYTLASKLKPNDVIFLYGDLGSGKTTFTHYLAEALGFSSRVQSPTFVIVRKYVNRTGKLVNNISLINHIDLYRLQSADDLIDLGLEDILAEPNSLTVIEWPELVEASLDSRLNIVKIYLTIIDDFTRSINVQNID